jgi:hypothetical protein
MLTAENMQVLPLLRRSNEETGDMQGFSACVANPNTCIKHIFKYRGKTTFQTYDYVEGQHFFYLQFESVIRIYIL